MSPHAFTPPAAATPPHRRPPHRWDVIVRLTHWGVVVAVIANALVTEEGSGPHIWVGYALTALLALRLVWGFVGTKAARFSAFPPSPSQTVAHLRDIAAGRSSEHASHNPLGAWMVYAIWLCLTAIIATGIAMSGPPVTLSSTLNGATAESAASARNHAVQITEGRDAEYEEGEGRQEGGEHEGGEEAMEEIHEGAVNLLYLLIALHLAGVIFETRRSGAHILRAMLPGGTRRKP